MNECHSQDLRSLLDDLEDVGAKVDGSKKGRVKKQMRLNVLRAKNSASLSEKEEKELGKLRGELKRNLSKLIKTVSSIEKAIRTLDNKAGGKQLGELEDQLDQAKKKEGALKTSVKHKQAVFKAAKADLSRVQKSGKELAKKRKVAEATLKAGKQREDKKKELTLWQAEVAEADYYISKM
jgi:hypothetical protein